MDSLAKMSITEKQARAIFKYIASTLKCSDAKIFHNRLMMKGIDTNFWFSAVLVHDNGIYHSAFEHDYVSMLNKIIKFKYLVIENRVYKIPNSLEELLIEMDLNG